MCTLNSLLTLNLLKSFKSFIITFRRSSSTIVPLLVPLLVAFVASVLLAHPVQARTVVGQAAACVPAPDQPESSALIDSFDALDSTAWAIDPTTHFAPVEQCNNNVLQSIGTPEGVWRSKLFYKRPLRSGNAAMLAFKLDSLNTTANFAIENGSDGFANRFGIEANQGKIYVKVFTGTFFFPGTLITPTKIDTWYELTLAVDDVNGFSMKLRDAETDQTATYTRSMPAGLAWNFSHYLLTGTAYLDNYAQSGQPLAISSVADEYIYEDGNTGPIAFRIGNFGPISAPVTLTVQNTNNARLLPPGSVVLNGSGLQRTVIITPAANQSGSATISLTLTTDTETTQRVFKIFVSPVDDAPIISDIDYKNTNRVPGGEPIGPLPFIIGDIDTPIISLTVSAISSNQSVLPPANIRIDGSGPTRTITLVPSAQTSGDVTVTVVVSDATSSISTRFNLSSFSRRFTPIVFGPAIQPTPPPCNTQPVDCFEPNNGFSTATPITPPVSLTATLNGASDQRDYFEMNLVAGRTYTFTTRFDNGDLDFYLYADTDRVIPVEKSDQTNTRFEHIVYTPTQGGRYFLLSFNYLAQPEPVPVLRVYRLVIE